MFNSKYYYVVKSNCRFINKYWSDRIGGFVSLAGAEPTKYNKTQAIIRATQLSERNMCICTICGSDLVELESITKEMVYMHDM